MANPIPFQAIWTDYFGQIIDYHDYGMLFDQIRSAVLAGPWYGVYDLIQWLVQNTHTPDDYGRYGSPSHDFNRILARNRADHRLVDRHVVPISDETELTAITTTSTPAGNHIKNALVLFANRDNPNFWKSIQESISAAESAAQELAGVTKPQTARCGPRTFPIPYVRGCEEEPLCLSVPIGPTTRCSPGLA